MGPPAGCNQNHNPFPASLPSVTYMPASPPILDNYPINFHPSLSRVNSMPAERPIIDNNPSNFHPSLSRVNSMPILDNHHFGSHPSNRQVKPSERPEGPRNYNWMPWRPVPGQRGYMSDSVNDSPVGWSSPATQSVPPPNSFDGYMQGSAEYPFVPGLADSDHDSTRGFNPNPFGGYGQGSAKYPFLQGIADSDDDLPDGWGGHTPPTELPTNNFAPENTSRSSTGWDRFPMFNR